MEQLSYKNIQMFNNFIVTKPIPMESQNFGLVYLGLYIKFKPDQIEPR